ncbi:hypothetical protein FHG55_00565 [Pseudomonas jessenii]|uniref:Uncharacterized protein n=1 Tax=Pseudomonas jessenii TaxID=77298 RepID=A0A5C4L2Z9_PSEJE|nr:hypothetical protein FHG55_00565 [Pseudomonas jessenii]
MRVSDRSLNCRGLNSGRFLWERACSRRRSVMQRTGCLTRPLREQARSHNCRSARHQKWRAVF